MKSGKLIFMMLIILMLGLWPYPAEAVFRDDVNSEEAGQFIEQERAKSKTELHRYLEKKEQQKAQGKSAAVSPKPKPESQKARPQSPSAKLGVIFLVLCLMVVGLFWFQKAFSSRNKENES